MKTKPLLVIFIASIFLLAIISNPNEEEHIKKVKETIAVANQKSLEKNNKNSENDFEELGNLLGESLVNTIVKNTITCDDYIFFSITKITFQEEEKSIGYGLFGTVFLSEKVEEEFNKHI